MPAPMTAKTFFARFKHLAEDDCWIWPGVKSEGGYGRAMIGGVACKAHRLAAFFSGKITVLAGQSPEKLPTDNVLHTCDNPACCNPAHLFIGSQSDNINDMFSKGRNPKRPSGEGNVSSKLTEERVVEILQADTSIFGEKARLARKHGVSKTVIGAIVARKIWKNIDVQQEK